jgi:hypothetical protein
MRGFRGAEMRVDYWAVSMVAMSALSLAEKWAGQTAVWTAVKRVALLEKLLAVQWADSWGLSGQVWAAKLAAKWAVSRVDS